MILNNEVIISLTSRVINYYQNLGYDLSFLKVNNKIMKGSRLKVLVKDLPKYSRVLVIKECEICQIKYEIKYCDAIKYPNFCNHCMITRNKSNSPFWKGGLPKCENCGKELQNRNAKLCLQCLGFKQRGKNNPNYNIEKTDEARLNEREYPKYIEWRKFIYKRDNYICQCCHKGGCLNAHHIENYGKDIVKNTDIDNGITLCVDCHRKFHKKYGRKNNNEEQLNEFMVNYE